jgi:hypothetical protein
MAVYSICSSVGASDAAMQGKSCGHSVCGGVEIQKLAEQEIFQAEVGGRTMFKKSLPAAHRAEGILFSRGRIRRGSIVCCV